MKVKELFSILEKYNYIARLAGEREKHIHFSIDDNWKGMFETFTEFKKWLKEEFVGEVVTEILEQTFTFNQSKILGFYDCLGRYDEIRVEFEV